MTNRANTAASAIDQSLRTGTVVTIEHDQYQFGLLCQESKDFSATSTGATFWGMRGGQEWCVKMAPRG